MATITKLAVALAIVAMLAPAEGRWFATAPPATTTMAPMPAMATKPATTTPAATTKPATTPAPTTKPAPTAAPAGRTAPVATTTAAKAPVAANATASSGARLSVETSDSKFVAKVTTLARAAAASSGAKSGASGGGNRGGAGNNGNSFKLRCLKGASCPSGVSGAAGCCTLRTLPMGDFEYNSCNSVPTSGCDTTQVSTCCFAFSE